MSQTNYTPISLYYSATASATPTSGNLVAGELALNTNDGKLFYKDSSGVVQTLASKAGNVNVSSFSAGSTGLTPSTATTGAVTLAGTLNVSSGGTGLTTLTAGYIPYGNGTSAFSSSSNLFYNGNLGIGTSSPSSQFVVSNAGANGFEVNPTGTNSGTNFLSYNRGTGSFTTLNYYANDHRFYYGASSVEGMRLDSSGNLGLGVTPSAWSAIKPLEFINGVFVASYNVANVANAYFGCNTYYNGTNWIYKTTDYASYYQQSAGKHLWYNAPSSTSGATATFTQAMTLDNSGRLLVGKTSGLSTVDVVDTGNGGVRVTSGTTDLRLLCGASAAYLYNASNTPTIFTINTTEVARFDTSGNLLVGATASLTGSSRRALTLNAPSGQLAIVELGVNGTVTGYLFSNVSQTTLNTQGATPLTFETNSAERMRIDSSGNLLVGTTSTNVTAGGIFAAMTSGNSSIGVGHVTGTASGQYYAQFSYAGTLIGSISQSGTTAVLYNTTSDQRLKENIVDAPSGNIDNIKVRSFDWKSDGSHQEYGMVAQELVKVAPYAVHQPQDAEEMMAVDYSKLVPMMIKEIQDLKKEVALLKANK